MSKRILVAFATKHGSTREVAEAIAAGRSADEVAESGLTSDLDASWGQGFMKPAVFLRLVHASLGGG